MGESGLSSIMVCQSPFETSEQLSRFSFTGSSSSYSSCISRPSFWLKLFTKCSGPLHYQTKLPDQALQQVLGAPSPDLPVPCNGPGSILRKRLSLHDVQEMQISSFRRFDVIILHDNGGDCGAEEKRGKSDTF